MTHHSADHPALLSLLEAARGEPHDDAPRLVLADCLDDHGEHDRAEFVRLQLRLAPGSPPLNGDEREELERRCRHLLGRRGGCWLAGLWSWQPPATCWHRGLLTLRVPRRYDPSAVEEAASWVDTLLFRLSGRDSLRRADDLLCRTGANHAGLDLRDAPGERALLAEPARLPGLPYLRTLRIDWPPRLLAPVEGGRRPAVGAPFLRGLLALPSTGRLTHLASNWPFDERQSGVIRGLGVEPANAAHGSWMHDLPPGRFRPRGRHPRGE